MQEKDVSISTPLFFIKLKLDERGERKGRGGEREKGRKGERTQGKGGGSYTARALAVLHLLHATRRTARLAPMRILTRKRYIHGPGLRTNVAHLAPGHGRLLQVQDLGANTQRRYECHGEALEEEVMLHCFFFLSFFFGFSFRDNDCSTLSPSPLPPSPRMHARSLPR